MSDDRIRFSRLTRRGVLSGVVGGAAAAILAACGDTAPAGTATAPAATTAPTMAAAPTAAATTAPAVVTAAPTTAPAAMPTAATSGATVAPSAASAASPSAGSAMATASSGVALAPPLPDMAKFKGQTLQMVSKNEYFKGSETALDMALQDMAGKVGVKIENNRLNQDTGNVVAKLDQSIKGNDAPDLLYFDRFLSQFVQLDDLVDMTDVVQKAQELYGPVEDGGVIAQRFNGKYFSLPYFANANGWFLRTDWLMEKGIKPSDLKTFENVRDVALAISDPSKGRYGWGLTTNASGDGISTINNVLNAYGGVIVSDDGMKVVLNSPETLEAVNFLTDIYTNPKYKNMLPPGVNSWTDPSNNEAWLTGNIGITVNGYTLYAQSFATMNPVYKVTGIAPGFTGPATDQVIATPGTGYLAIPKGAKNIELAKATALYLTGGPAFLALAKPSLGLILPTYKNQWKSDPFYASGDPSFPALQQIIQGKLPIKTKTGYNFPQAPSPIYELGINSQRITCDMMGEIILKGTKPQDAIKEATARLVTAANQLGIKQ